jgi:hypothetical protein
MPNILKNVNPCLKISTSIKVNSIIGMALINSDINKKELVLSLNKLCAIYNIKIVKKIDNNK